MNADELADGPAVAEGHDVGNRLHAEGAGHLLVLVDIDLHELKAAVELDGQLFQERPQLPHGWHQVAQKSTTTGRSVDARITSASNRSVVVSMIQGELTATLTSVCLSSV